MPLSRTWPEDAGTEGGVGVGSYGWRVCRAWQRPTLPRLSGAVPSALGVFTAEFGMGSGVLPPAMATRPGEPAGWVTGCGPAGRPGLAAGRGRYRRDWRVRAISTGQLAPIARLPPPAYRRGGLPRLSTRPGFEGGFPLRCVQRLSRPHLATRHCGGRHNRYTRGASLPVLSYWGERLASLEHPRQIGTELSHDVLNPAHVPL